MPTTETTTTHRMTDAEASGTFAQNLTNGVIIIVDGSDVPTGEVRQVNASGVLPTSYASIDESTRLTSPSRMLPEEGMLRTLRGDYEDNAACENKADDGEPCGNEGRYYSDYQMYLCDSCADGYGVS